MATPLEHIRPGSFVLVEMEDRVDQQSNQRKEKNQRNREPTSMENKNLVYTEDASVKKKQRDESNKVRLYRTKQSIKRPLKPNAVVIHHNSTYEVSSATILQ